jgi:methyl-accepting chemotaxis protein
MRWFYALSIRWKLQLSFFLVTMLTIGYVRWDGYRELAKLIDIVKQNQPDPMVVAQLDGRLHDFVVAALWQSTVEFAVLFLVIAALAKLFVAPLQALCLALRDSEQGDLTRTVQTRSQDEIGVLGRHFNAMLAGLTGIIRNIDNNSAQMAQSAYQVATIAHEIGQVSQSENAAAEEMTAHTAELMLVSESVQHLAQEAVGRATVASEGAQAGIAYVETNIERMEDTVSDVNRASDQVTQLKDAAQQIYDIIGTIRAIAEQTNLLALNAAIEAARAGESGRGFAVVADEVRDLASRTTASTARITEIINEVNAQVGQVADSMEGVVECVHGSQDRARETAQIIGRIAGEVSQSAESNRRIAEVSGAQLTQLQAQQGRLDGLFDSVKTNAAKVQSTGSIGDDLYQVTESLRAVLGQFRFERDSGVVRAANEKRIMPRLSHQLRVRFWQGDKHYESICSDLSLSGMKLRLPEQLDDGLPLALEIYAPYPDLKQYEAQRPINLSAKVVWQRLEEGRLQCGIHFDDMAAEQEQGLQRCFDYFHRDARYAAG